MYGTVARLRIKPGAMDVLKQFDKSAPRPEGAVAHYVYQMDDDPQELFLVVMFKDKESYTANANSPQQHQRYLQMQRWLQAEPTWHDGEIVYTHQA